MRRILTMLIFYPGFALAADAGEKTSSGEQMLGLLILVACAAVAFGLWNVFEWIGAKGDEAKERARKLKLESDKLEIELAEMRKKNTDAT